jgi:hypothetical protein
MKPSSTLAAFPALTTDRAQPFTPSGLLREALVRQRSLTIAALLIWAAMLPALIALGLDERTVREVNVWVKPLKFMASIGLFWLCTAWFIGLLPEAQRRHASVRALVAVALGAGLFEIGYITVQATLGQASHFNFSSPFHQVMYTLMGLAALAMTATQPVLAWRIARHGRADLAPVSREAVVIGLVLTFVLGAGAGGLLGSVQPPAGAGLPVVGWHLGGGDLRPAHFVGMHAQQFIPLVGALLATAGADRRWLWGFVALYTAWWVGTMAMGLDGAMFTPPPVAYSTSAT